MSSLRQQMIQDMVVRGFAQNTQTAYVRAVAQLALFYGRAPDRLSEREIQRFLVHLHQEKGLSYSTCNQVVAALRFFYRVTSHICHQSAPCGCRRVHSAAPARASEPPHHGALPPSHGARAQGLARRPGAVGLPPPLSARRVLCAGVLGSGRARPLARPRRDRSPARCRIQSVPSGQPSPTAGPARARVLPHRRPGGAPRAV